MRAFPFKIPKTPVIPIPLTEVKREEPALPPATTMAKNLISSIGQVAKQAIQGKGVYNNEEIAQRRLGRCNKCEFFRKSDQRCSRCGCWMAVKTYLKAMECPLKYW